MHWKDWCWSSNTLAMYAKNWIIGKNLDAGKDWGQEEKGNREWVGYSQLMDTDSMDISLSKLQEIVKDREARHTAVHRVAKNQTWLSYWTTTQASSLFTKYIKHYLHNKKGSFHKIRNFRQKIKYICIHICVCVYIYIYNHSENNSSCHMVYNHTSLSFFVFLIHTYTEYLHKYL